MMGYIAGLTVILHGFIVFARDVSTGEVHEVVDHHLQSRLREKSYQDIGSMYMLKAVRPGSSSIERCFSSGMTPGAPSF